MYRKMQASGLTEIIPLICTSALWGQYPTFVHPGSPQGVLLEVWSRAWQLAASLSPSWVPSGLTIRSDYSGLRSVTSFIYWCDRQHFSPQVPFPRFYHFSPSSGTFLRLIPSPRHLCLSFRNMLTPFPLKNTTKTGYDLKCAVSSLSTLLQLSFLRRVSGRWGNETPKAASSPTCRLKPFFSASIILEAKSDGQLSASSYLTSPQWGIYFVVVVCF